MPELGDEGGAGVSEMMDAEEVGLIGQHEDVQAIGKECVVLRES